MLTIGLPKNGKVLTIVWLMLSRLSDFNTFQLERPLASRPNRPTTRHHTMLTSFKVQLITLKQRANVTCP